MVALKHGFKTKSCAFSVNFARRKKSLCVVKSNGQTLAIDN